jgi:hypothetical protein
MVSGEQVKTMCVNEKGFPEIGFGSILKENDISGYRENYPGKKWELVQYDDGEISWVKRKNMRRIKLW